MNVKLLMTIFSIVVLNANNIQFSKAQTCPNLETNIDYFGNDITFAIVTSIALCCSKCASQPGCTSFTYVTAANTCWLKNATSSNNVKRLNSVGRVSSFIVLPPTTTSTTTTTTTTTATTTSTTISTTNPTPITQTYGCFIEYNINYYGSDYSANAANNTSDCCNMCGSDPQCLVWTFLTDVKFCFLKNFLPRYDQRETYANSISGIVVLR